MKTFMMYVVEGIAFAVLCASLYVLTVIITIAAHP
jgi:hypothetical protein